jgi:hypothetical protein
MPTQRRCWPSYAFDRLALDHRRAMTLAALFKLVVVVESVAAVVVLGLLLAGPRGSTMPAKGVFFPPEVSQPQSTGGSGAAFVATPTAESTQTTSRPSSPPTPVPSSFAAPLFSPSPAGQLALPTLQPLRTPAPAPAQRSADGTSPQAGVTSPSIPAAPSSNLADAARSPAVVAPATTPPVQASSTFTPTSSTSPTGTPKPALVSTVVAPVRP